MTDAKIRPRPRIIRVRVLTARTAWCVATVACLTALLGSPGASAAESSAADCQTVHVGPEVQPGSTASYFRLTAAAGTSTREAVLIANPAAVACSVLLAPAYGKTASNSGDTYPVARPAGTCVRTSCWITGLPASETVPANSRRSVPFVVTVPAGTPPGDFLAGVVVRPSGAGVAPPQASGTGVGARVKTSVGIGVAVRVPGALRPDLTIPTVTLDTSEHTPRLHVVEHDSGNTWEHPAGGAIIHTSGAHPLKFGTSSSTILPGDSATLTVPVLGTKKGRHPTEVLLHYDHFTKVAVWRGVLDYPTSVAARRPGEPAVVHRSSIPTWLVILAVLLGLAVLLLLVALLVLLRRRRGQGPNEAGDGSSDHHGDPAQAASEA